MKTKSIKFIIMLLLCMAIAIAGVAAASAEGRLNHPDFYVVVTSSAGEIHFRAGAGSDSQILGEIPNGTILYIADISYNAADTFLWGETTYAGQNGWVSLRQTTILTGDGYQAPDFDAEISSDSGSANFRSRFGTDSPVITEIPNWTQLHFTGLVYNEADGFFWGYTSYNGQDGWVSIRQTGIRKEYVTNVIPPADDDVPAEVRPSVQVVTSRASEEEIAEREEGLFLRYNWLDSYTYENTETLMTADGPVYSYLDGRVSFQEASAAEPKRQISMGIEVGPKWAIITGYDDDGAQTWQVVTEQVFVLNGGYSCLGASEDLLFYTDFHSLYALDVESGEQMWANEDISRIGGSDGGFHGSAVGKEGELYISATNGAGFMAVDERGRTLALEKGRYPDTYIQHAQVVNVWYFYDASLVLLEDPDGKQVEYYISRNP